jgi:hypothetical protein
MSAQHDIPYHATPLPRDHRAVLAALPEDLVPTFDSKVQAVFDEAREHRDLVRLQNELAAVTGKYWAIASALHSPRARTARDAGRQWRDGQPIDSVDGKDVLAGLR